MNRFFRKLPFPAKLMLIGLIPFGFLVLLTVNVYRDKTAKLHLFENYKTYLSESADISNLVDALQEERKFSYDYVLTQSMHREMVLQRPTTDSLLQKLSETDDPALKGFINYTKLKNLSSIRSRVDSSKIKADEVMYFYSNTVFRMNTLNTIPPANTAYLQPVFKDLMAQKILSEMITYLGIIRSNIYNVLLTRKYMIETLIGTVGTHDVYNSYEEELMAKASPEMLAKYKNMRNITAYKPTIIYIDTLFKKFAFDSSYTAPEWWKISEAGTNELKKLQDNTWQDLNEKINSLYKQEETSRKEALLFLILALVAVVAIVSYIVYIVSHSLGQLRRAAEKISNGETGVAISAESDDVIGGLARSMIKIDESNRVLAEAAMAIGKGNFNVATQPRSKNDILGNAVLQMKNELALYNRKMEQLVAERTEELGRSNADLQQFAHVASHDLKEPLRKISTFSSILMEEQRDCLTEKGKLYLDKIDKAARRMSAMIEGVLTYSMISDIEQSFEQVNLNRIMNGVENDLELAIIQKEAEINYAKLPSVHGIPLLMQQLFYNLVSNALKFARTDIKPVINIKTVAEQESFHRTGFQPAAGVTYTHIIVEDNGIGFDKIYAENMFSVFYRLHDKDTYEGTGLGLALCRKIVHRHKGEIYAEGDERTGACFHLLLPLKKQD